MIERVKFLSPEVILGPDGSELLRRYSAAEYLAGVLGDNWQDRYEHLIEEHCVTQYRHIDEHETNVDLGNDTPRVYCIDTLPVENIHYAEQARLMKAYNDFHPLIVRVAMDVGADVEPGMYEKIEDAINPIFRQTPPTTGVSDVDNYSRSMEPHRDGRFAGLIVVRAPEHEGGELVILDDDLEEITRVRHREASLVCFPAGRRLPHYTTPLKREGDKRIIIGLNYPHPGETDEERDSVKNIGNNWSQ